MFFNKRNTKKTRRIYLRRVQEKGNITMEYISGGGAFAPYTYIITHITKIVKTYKKRTEPPSWQSRGLSNGKRKNMARYIQKKGVTSRIGSSSL